MSKARTKAAKRREKSGPKPIQDVPRTPSGQISRSADAQKAMSRLELEAVTWKRRQIDPSLSPEQARLQEHGSVIARWRQDHIGFARRYPGKPNQHEFTQLHYDTAEKFHKLYMRYMAVLEAKRVFSSTDFSRTGGYDGTDPFNESLARQHAETEASFKEARCEILKADPLGMMALETIVIENQPADGLRGELRTALNRLALLWKLTSQAA